AVADQDCASAGQQVDEIGHLAAHGERSGMWARASVTAAVVPQHAEVGIEPTTEFEHPRRAVHRTVNECDQRPIRFAGLLGPHRVHATRTMRSTSVDAPLAPSGAPASTSTV